MAIVKNAVVRVGVRSLKKKNILFQFTMYNLFYFACGLETVFLGLNAKIKIKW